MVERVGESSRVIRSGLSAEDRGDAAACLRLSVARADADGRFAQHPAAAALLTGLVAHRDGRLTHSQGGQQPPKVVPPVQLGKLTSAGAIAKALEGADRHVFLVKRTAAMAG